MIPETALLCLALNSYHEARGEPVEGQVAVNLVVLNRVKRNGSSICKEVFRPSQFSWTRNPPKVKKKDVLLRLKHIARASLHIKDYTNGATHYHAKYVYPEWASHMVYVGQWGNHLFYKEK